ncbi:unnamed protein product [Porites lobata]|uniref:Ig-like domain-containing protein n=1 Tax=Porites lobata TaxID=104759 RepID=A0ABN8RT37_9CNID|nr:unnamed protein product [Porites lobata]
MVTVITDKLKDQSLEDLPCDEAEISCPIQLRLHSANPGHISECPLSYKLRRDGRLASGHLRTRSYPSHRPKRTYCKNCSGADSSSFMHCTPKPPANKKLCSSLSLPDNESSERQLSWVPRASSVWQPVEHCGAKPRSISCPDEKMKLAESMRIKNEMEAISTPPASPTPRPASANAALGDKNIVFKNESAHCDFAGHDVRDFNFNWKPNVLGLHRSRSQPCFDRMRTIGVKRRIDEVLDARRPALDLSKMEETSYYRCRDREKGLRIPKYMNKRPTKGLTSYFTESENFKLKPIASSPLDAQDCSIMITPTSSPTKQLDSENIQIVCDFKGESKFTEGENSRLEESNPKAQDEGVFHLDYESDLDLHSIEEDLF